MDDTTFVDDGMGDSSWYSCGYVSLDAGSEEHNSIYEEAELRCNSSLWYNFSLDSTDYLVIRREFLGYRCRMRTVDGYGYIDYGADDGVYLLHFLKYRQAENDSFWIGGAA